MDQGAESEAGYPRGITHLCTLMAVFAGALLIILMALTVLDVFLRQARGSGVTGTIEISSTLLAAAVYLGMAPAEMDGAHVRTGLLLERLKPTWATRLRAFGWAITTAFLTWLTAKNLSLALSSFSIREYRIGVSNTPVWPAKAAVAMGLTAFLITAVWALVSYVRASIRGNR